MVAGAYYALGEAVIIKPVTAVCKVQCHDFGEGECVGNRSKKNFEQETLRAPLVYIRNHFNQNSSNIVSNV
jgi:hypothetical protein